jgi:hypothetical protein
MARGWESKDVEAQVDANQGKKQDSSGHQTQTAAQVTREQQRKDFQLSRTRIVNDLSSATNPNHRKSLEAALAHLDQKIAELS